MAEFRVVDRHCGSLSIKSFAHEFSERGVGKWAIGYLTTVWLSLQVLQLLWEVFDRPIAPLRILIGTVAVGFPIFVLFAWYRDTTDDPRETTKTAARGQGGDLRKAIATTLIVVLLIAGGAWSDASCFFSGPNVQHPLERLPENGIRLARYLESRIPEGTRKTHCR